MTTLLDRCAALIDKIGRGPEWRLDGETRRRLLFDKYIGLTGWVIQGVNNKDQRWVLWDDMDSHEAACILEKWLEDVELPKKDVFIHRFEGRYLPVMEVYSSEDDDWPLHKDGEFKEADPDEGTEAWAYTRCKFTALIEAAEKVLVKE